VVVPVRFLPKTFSQPPAGARTPLKRDSKPYLEWTIEDWMENPWDRRDVETMREWWPGITDEAIIRQLRQQ
jgi:hypothetical protein